MFLLTSRHVCGPTRPIQTNLISQFSYSDFAWRRTEVNFRSNINSYIRKLYPQIESFGASSSFRGHSARILKCWTQQLEFITAHRIRRTFQIVSLYKRWWGSFNGTFSFRRLTNDKWKLCFTACLAPLFEWDKQRIQSEEFSTLLDELFKNKRSAANPGIQYPLPLTEPMENPYGSQSVDTACGCTRCRHAASDDWEMLYEGRDMKIWRQEHIDHRGEGLYVYKVYGHYKEITAEDFFRVQIDINYRKEWDANSIELNVVDSDTKSNSDILYWEFLFPRMFYNRDYVCNRRYEVNEEKQFMAVVSESVEHPACPEKPPVHRVKEYWSHVVIRPTNGSFSEPGMEFSVTYFDNPELSIPSYISVWYSINGMPEYLSQQRKAALTLARRRIAKEEEKPETICVLPNKETVNENRQKDVQGHPHKRVLLM